MIDYCTFETPLGAMLATAESGALTGLYFAGQKYCPAIGAGWRERADAEPFAAAREQVAGYFAGTRRAFDLPLAPAGGRATAFQREVWRRIAEVRAGETITYGELARRCGRPAAVRAAGAATGRNPLSLIVPCHRIVGHDGALTGYAGGVDRKRALLAFERDAVSGRPGPITVQVRNRAPGRDALQAPELPPGFR